MKIGLIDIDTSHPENWIPFLRQLGHDVAAVFDAGAVHSPQDVRVFADKHGIPLVASRIEEVPQHVDCAIIHSCNWDVHVARAAPFIAAGKSVLIDKPMAGRVADLQQLQRWVREGARISGGSSLRFTNEVRNYLARPEDDRGAVHTVFAGCGIDEFNYGIHAYALLWSVMGAGAKRVRWLGGGVQWRVEVEWNDQRSAVLSVGGKPWLPCYATVVTTKGVQYLTPLTTPDPLYKGLLTQVLPYLEGRAPPPLPLDELIEPELAALAALSSRQRGGEFVDLDQIPADIAYDGGAFAIEYRRQRGK
jgi:hypothetical protein